LSAVAELASPTTMRAKGCMAGIRIGAASRDSLQARQEEQEREVGGILKIESVFPNFEQCACK